MSNKIDELELRNSVDALYPDPPEDIKEMLAWQRKYAKWPTRIGKKIVWRKEYWQRMCMLKEHDHVVTLTKPKTEGYYYGLTEMLGNIKSLGNTVTQTTVKGVGVTIKRGR